jgi:hypothetical protein
MLIVFKGSALASFQRIANDAIEKGAPFKKWKGAIFN